MVDKWLWVYNIGVIILIGKNWRIGIKSCYSVTVSTNFPTWNDLGLYLDVWGERLATTIPESYFILCHTPLTTKKEQIIFHLFLTFGTRFRRLVSFTSWQLYPSKGVDVELYVRTSPHPYAFLTWCLKLSTGQLLWSWYKHKHDNYLTNIKHIISIKSSNRTSVNTAY